MESDPRYSLRAYARALGVSAGALSQIMAGRRLLSEKLAQRFFDALGLSSQEQAKFLASLGRTKRFLGLKRISPELKRLAAASADEHLEENEKRRELSPEIFRVIADWHHYAILEATHLPQFRADPRWIASHLGIPVFEAKLAVERLLDLELLVQDSGTLKKADSWLETTDRKKTSSAHRHRQKQILLKSIQSLENDPIASRNHSAVTLPIDPELLPEAKQRIQDFMDELARFLSRGRKERVYELTLNLFPLSKEPPSR